MSQRMAVVVEELGRRFGEVEAVTGLSMEIGEGEIFGLLGPNGAGKTTTLSMLSTLLAPTSGNARIFGHSLDEDVEAVRGLVGLAPQRISLYPQLSADENLHFFGRLYGLRGSALRGRTDLLLERVGLAERRRDRVETYSGGMQRRLNLACALLHAPRLLLLDEPTAGVDPQSREHLFAMIREVADSGTAVLYTTHYMEEAERLCDRIAILDDGRIAACGTCAELLSIVGFGEVIELHGARPVDRERLARLPGFIECELRGDVTRVFVRSAAHAVVELSELLGGADELPGLEIYRLDLERVFLHLTGRELRD